MSHRSSPRQGCRAAFAGVVSGVDWGLRSRPSGRSRPSAAHAADTDVVTIPDANLKARLNARLGSGRPATQDITVGEAASLTGTYSLTGPFADLTGLEAFVNVRGLTIAGISTSQASTFTSLAPLAGLTNLTTLTLQSGRARSVETARGADEPDGPHRARQRRDQSGAAGRADEPHVAEPEQQRDQRCQPGAAAAEPDVAEPRAQPDRRPGAAGRQGRSREDQDAQPARQPDPGRLVAGGSWERQTRRVDDDRRGSAAGEQPDHRLHAARQLEQAAVLGPDETSSSSTSGPTSPAASCCRR